MVDDEVSVRKALSRLLRSAGMDVDMYPSGAAFLASLQHSEPDCVVLDLHMPGVNGFDVLDRLKEWGKALPLIIITGHHTAKAHALAISGGADLYLLKPIEDRVLLDGITYAMLQHEH